MKIEWIGRSGFTPGVGNTNVGDIFDLPAEQAKQLVSEGKAKLLEKKLSTGDKK